MDDDMSQDELDCLRCFAKDAEGTRSQLAELGVSYAKKAGGNGAGSIALFPSLAPPDQIRFLRVNFDTSDTKFECGIVEGGHSAVSSWQSASNVIRDCIQNDSFPTQGHTLVEENGYNRSQPLNKMSILAPVRHEKDGAELIESKRCLYVIQVPDCPGESNVDWRFSTTVPPISFVDSKLKVKSNNGNNENTLISELYLSELSHCLNPDSSPAYSEQRRRNQVFFRPLNTSLGTIGSYEATKWACFMMDFERLKRDVGLAGQDDPSLDFALRYNLHIEIKDSVRGHYIPIIIDPDIGHPGGNAPDP